MSLEDIVFTSPFVNVVVLGDNSKTLLMPLWGKQTALPGAWTVVHPMLREGVKATIWDVKKGTVSAMYPHGSIDLVVIVTDDEDKLSLYRRHASTLTDKIPVVLSMERTDDIKALSAEANEVVSRINLIYSEREGVAKQRLQRWLESVSQGHL